ncbi:DUF3124 domain-containing protein [Flammeovirga pacifica]|uniref:DUF3124 domain-containing protein n=1 Tax=Flammeovirga pacifica TaxID=915059 RepID=A0A1S1Z2P5_FLAPC|nr:DUF3124 domain-containing protein [Flammeovirga pacifica]OHX67443.1 hypothetical protein NH26_14370 [Flammeovirga pacifica]
MKHINKKVILSAIILTFFVIALSCNKINKFGLEEVERSLHHIELDQEYIPELHFKEKRYIPAYSNLYYKSKSASLFCTVILSIRNTSMTDDIYLNSVDYYNTYGEKIKELIQKTNKLRPLETREFVIEFNDKLGGSGANFIVDYGAKNALIDVPIIESVSVGHHGNNGFTITSNSQVIQTNKH